MTPLERQVKVLREGLEKIKSRVPIMGSRGDYRDGQMVALLACELVAIEALAESDRIEAEKPSGGDGEATVPFSQWQADMDSMQSCINYWRARHKNAMEALLSKGGGV